jgi:hypothetical protein
MRAVQALLRARSVSHRAWQTLRSGVPRPVQQLHFVHRSIRSRIYRESPDPSRAALASIGKVNRVGASSL